MMAKYRKKPVVIDAWLWDETKETYAMLIDAGMPSCSYNSHVTENYVRNLRLPTREGTMSVEKGDWIIKFIEGGFFHCSPGTFEATYEAAEPIWQPLTRGGHAVRGVGATDPNFKPGHAKPSWNGWITTKTDSMEFQAFWQENGSFNADGSESEFDLIRAHSGK
jgi:hypothetical protein